MKQSSGLSVGSTNRLIGRGDWNVKRLIKAISSTLTFFCPSRSSLMLIRKGKYLLWEYLSQREDPWLNTSTIT